MTKAKKYRVDLSYVGFDFDFDNLIYNKVGYSDGSGCGGLHRDHTWYDLTNKKAISIKSKLETLLRKEGVEGTVCLEMQENF